jgi:CRP-like cAMP-binding protein
MGRSNLSNATIKVKPYLQQHIYQLGLPPEAAEELLSHCTLANYNKGAIVALRGSPADVLFYVVSGLLKIYCSRPNGTRILVKLVGPGDLAGYADYLGASGVPAQIFEIDALTKSSVAILAREHIWQVLNTLERSALLRVIERLNTAWSSMAQRFGTFLGMSFQERLEFILKELAAKFGVQESRGILLTPELVHADFADMIGSSRPMVTRLMAEMTNRGVLLREGKRLILRGLPEDQPSSMRNMNTFPASAHRIGSRDGLPQDGARTAKIRESASGRLAQSITMSLPPPMSNASLPDPQPSRLVRSG